MRRLLVYLQEGAYSGGGGAYLRAALIIIFVVMYGSLGRQLIGGAFSAPKNSVPISLRSKRLRKISARRKECLPFLAERNLEQVAPTFAQPKSGKLYLSLTRPSAANVQKITEMKTLVTQARSKYNIF